MLNYALNVLDARAKDVRQLSKSHEHLESYRFICSLILRYAKNNLKLLLLRGYSSAGLRTILADNERSPARLHFEYIRA